jgi:ATP-dependent exoDNAse (exonuclease V) beta subunit
LLYVALTRARDRLIIEWPQDHDKVEPPLPITARRLLNDACGMKLQGNQINVGAVNFASRMTICGKEIPASFDGEGRLRVASNDREPRFAIERRAIGQLTPVISPSQTIATARPLPSQIDTRAISVGVRLTGSDLAHATDRGTAVHEALRILLSRSDLRHRVGEGAVSPMRNALCWAGLDL